MLRLKFRASKEDYKISSGIPPYRKIAMLATSTALLGLRDLIKALMPSDHYATELVPTFNSVATQLEDLHTDVNDKQVRDLVTLVILIILVAVLTIEIIIMGFWVQDVGRTFACLSRGITVVLGEMKIRHSETFPPVKRVSS